MADTIHITGDTVEGTVLLPPGVDWITVTGDNTPSKLISNGTPTLTGFEPDDVEIETLSGKTLTFEDTDRERFYDLGIALTVSTAKYSVTVPENTTKTVYTKPFEITTSADIDVLVDRWRTVRGKGKSWSVEATGARTVTFDLSDMLAGKPHDLDVDGTKVDTQTSSDPGGIVTLTYSGAFSTKSFNAHLSTGTCVWANPACADAAVLVGNEMTITSSCITDLTAYMPTLPAGHARYKVQECDEAIAETYDACVEIYCADPVGLTVTITPVAIENTPSRLASILGAVDTFRFIWAWR